MLARKETFFFFVPPPPRLLHRCYVVLVFQERCLPSLPFVSVTFLPPGILSSIHSCFHLFSFPLTGQLRLEFLCDFLRCWVVFRRTVRAGRWAGWETVIYLEGCCSVFFICDCKERILVAGWCTDLVRGTKTARKKRMEIGREVRNCKINRAKKRVKQTNVMCNLQKEQMIGIERAAGGRIPHTPTPIENGWTYGWTWKKKSDCPHRMASVVMSTCFDGIHETHGRPTLAPPVENPSRA